MKIDRLMTLSQFVDYTTSHNNDEWTCVELIIEANEIDCYVGSEIATKIHLYNNFLKQPLTKEIIDSIEFDYRFIIDTCYVIFIDINGNEHEITNLSDLAQATNGQLRLKNVDI